MTLLQYSCLCIVCVSVGLINYILLRTFVHIIRWDMETILIFVNGFGCAAPDRKWGKSGLQTILFNLGFCLEDACFRPVGSPGQGFEHLLHFHLFTSSPTLRQIIDQVLLQEDRLHILHHLNLFEETWWWIKGAAHCSPGSTDGRWSKSVESTDLCFF